MRKELVLFSVLLISSACATSETVELKPAVRDFTPENTAIVVVEFQKQWTEPRFPGVYYRMIRKQYESRNVYEQTVRLLTSARSAEYPVVQAPLIIDPKEKKGIFAWLTMGNVFTKGRERSEFTEGIVAKTDHIVSGRYGFNGFLGSDLEKTLNKTGAKNILFCGFTTEHCVDMTMNAAEKKGYTAWLIPECTATKNARLQKKTEEKWGHAERIVSLSEAVEVFNKEALHNNDPWD